MSTIQDHADAVLALLEADAGLAVYDGKVTGTADHYVLVYLFRLRPDGLVAPDKIPLTAASVTVDMRLYCHCVGRTASAARAMQGRVEALLLDVVPTVTGRACSPIRLLDGQQASRDEQTLVSSFDQVDVYGFWSQPA